MAPDYLNGLTKQPYCTIHDAVARVAINIPVALEHIGVGKITAKNMAVEWLQARLNIPRLIAWEVHNCLLNHHKVCSLGNKLCDLKETKLKIGY